MAVSNKGKFGERLKRILFYRRNRKIKNRNDNSLRCEDSQEIYNNFVKVVNVIPAVVFGNITSQQLQNVELTSTSNNVNQEKFKNNDVNHKFSDKKFTVENAFVDNEGVTLNKKSIQDERIDAVREFKKKNRNIISNIDVLSMKKRQKHSYRHKMLSVESKDERIKVLEKSIINLIKKDLIKIVNEMEILQSELYVLSEVNGDNKTLNECQNKLNEIKSIICKVDKLKEKYDFLRDNYDFEYLLEIDNNDLVNKIIELRDNFGKEELTVVAEDYKLLDVYKYLYLKLDDFQDKNLEFEKKKEEEKLKLKERDIDFEELKTKVYNIGYTNRNYDYFVQAQNEILKELDTKISKIDSYEQVEYHLKGFDELLKNCFKYFGLLMVNPLKGLIPAIATETIITSNLIKNLYKDLSWEKTEKTVYEAIDYSGVIKDAIIDLDSTSRIVDATLDDIVRLKMEYNNKFKMYQGDFYEYRDVMHKINDMENKILGNKIKVEIMRKKALEQQMENSNKMKLVKELNKKIN